MKYYSLKEASVIVGYKVRTLRGMISAGKVLGVKYPNVKGWYISEDEVKKLTEVKNANKD